MKEPTRIKLTSKPTSKDVKKIPLKSIYQTNSISEQTKNLDNNENHSENNSESI